MISCIAADYLVGQARIVVAQGWQPFRDMTYVYLLRSAASPAQRYVGVTSDLRRRPREHDDGRSPHTSKYRPWHLVAYFAFHDRGRAIELERYLKKGSGQAFATKHLW